MHILSAPYNEDSINSNIDRVDASIHYASVLHALKNICSFTTPPFLSKTDIEPAFHIILMCPIDYYIKIGIYWQGKYFYDNHCCLTQIMSDF